MRQIKFRAWDNHYKRWLTAEAVGLNVKLNPVGRGCFSILPLDRFIDISQSTGLTDKNGKEIYEGDIVAHNEEREEVVFGNIGYDGSRNGLTGFVFKSGYDKEENFYELNYYDNPEEIEVVGNVYENPELLK